MSTNETKRNKELLRQAAQEAGLDLVGVGSPEPFVQLAEYLEARAGEGYLVPFTTSEVEERTNPRHLLPQAKSLLAVGMCYAPGPGPGQGLSLGSGNATTGLTGQVAAFAWGEDYHRLLMARIDRMLELWQELIGREITWKAQVDTGPLADRAAAWQAGLGWYGKNCNLISPHKGSWLVLGTVVTDVELEPDPPIASRCGECRRCLEACPTGALEAEGRLNAYRCISYLTQSPGLIPRELRKAMGSAIYGCDLCQQVCPHNKRANLPDSQPDQANCPVNLSYNQRSEVDLQRLLQLSNREFAREWGKTTAGWRGKKILQRNSLIALGNSGRVEALPFLLASLRLESPMLRAHGAWALGQFPLPEVRLALEQALEREQVPEVREEIVLALSIFFNNF